MLSFRAVSRRRSSVLACVFLTAVVIAFYGIRIGRSAVPATCTWTNGAGTQLWNNAGNWSGCLGGVPGVGIVTGADVVFDGTVSQSNAFLDRSVSINSFRMLQSYNGFFTARTHTMQIKGDFSHLGGTFVAATSTVVFDGAAGSSQTITGATAFSTLRFLGGQTIVLEPGVTTRVTAAFQAAGVTGGQPLKIVSRIPGLASIINVKGAAASATHVDVQDQWLVQDGVRPLNPQNSQNRGNNRLWFAPGRDAEPSRAPFIKIDGSVVNGPQGIVAGDRFGYAVANVGDVDRNGTTDLFMASPNNDASAPEAGSAYLSFLNQNGSVRQSAQITAATPNGPALAAGDLYGSSVAAVGDLNHDGAVEVAVGSPGANGGAGAVQIHSLTLAGGISRTIRLDGLTPNGAVLVAGDRYGSSLASLGDIDADGVADLAVGASGADGQFGRLFIHFMKTDGSVKRTVTIDRLTSNGPAGLEANGRYGFALGSIGDLDGDGVTDMAVGAPFTNGGGTDRGMLYIHLMNADGSVKRTVFIDKTTMNGPQLSDFDAYGHAVIGVGDYNRDGVPDLLVGAPGRDVDGAPVGGLYVHQMAADGSVLKTEFIVQSTPEVSSIQRFPRLGMSLSALGDMDKNGLVDFASGLSHEQATGVEKGVVYVSFVPFSPRDPDGPGEPGAECIWINASGDGKWSTPANWQNCLGGAPGVGAVVDHGAIFDGNASQADATIDVDLNVGTIRWRNEYRGTVHAGTATVHISGDFRHLTGGFDPGTAHFIFDRPSNTQTILGSNTFYDLDLIGAQTVLFEPMITQSILHRFEARGVSTTNRLRIRSTVSGTPAFLNVVGAEVADDFIDVDDSWLFKGIFAEEDFPDAVVGRNAFSWRTATYSYAEPNRSVVIREAVENGPVLSDLDQYGSSVTSIGDLDRDGVADVLVGSPDDNTGGIEVGSAYIHFLRADGRVKQTTELNAFTRGGALLFPKDRYGSAMTLIGDLDRDGVQEIAVSATHDQNPGMAQGAVFIHYMSRDGSIQRTAEINSATPNGPLHSAGVEYGTSLAGVGDLDRDGIADLAVSTPLANGGAGNVYIHFLQADGRVKRTVSINNLSPNGPAGLGIDEGYGQSVTLIGDVDHDGVQDLAVGAPERLVLGEEQGSVFIHLMNMDGSVKRTIELTGQTFFGAPVMAGDQYGASVAFAGDVNADGIQDLVVGAPGTDTIGTDMGAAYVHFLNADGTIIRTMNILPNRTGSPQIPSPGGFGRSVAMVSDLDGNGVPDFLTGTPTESSSGADRGASYLIYLQSVAPPPPPNPRASALTTMAPVAGRLLLNGGASVTDSPVIQVTYQSYGASQNQISPDPTFAGALWQPMQGGVTQTTYTLPAAEGVYVLFARAQSLSGQFGGLVGATIIYDLPGGLTLAALTNQRQVLEASIRSTFGYDIFAQPVGGPLLKFECPGWEDFTHPCRTVYYLGMDGERHAFPNERIFFTWFSDYRSLIIIPEQDLAAVPLAGDVLYRPGKMVKVVSDPKVYGVGAGGILYPLETEAVAHDYFGPGWQKAVDDLSDSFVSSYEKGIPLSQVNRDVFDPTAARAAAPSIDHQMRLVPLISNR
ncbi:FG-GAP repeat protein [Candidatus Uhrbacteria bacterium]|nr:FG-GAP repeat protein [Candidatus Uhrbacteria bacterium]